MDNKLRIRDRQFASASVVVATITTLFAGIVVFLQTGDVSLLIAAEPLILLFSKVIASYIPSKKNNGKVKRAL
jgi:hypothetical protein